jgi:hypothetical protein
MLRARRLTAAVVGAATALALALGGVVASAPAQAADVPTLTMSGITSGQVVSGVVEVTATLTLPSAEPGWNMYLAVEGDGLMNMACPDGEVVCQHTFLWDVSTRWPGRYRVGVTSYRTDAQFQTYPGPSTPRVAVYVQGVAHLGISSKGLARPGEIVPVTIGVDNYSIPSTPAVGATVRITITPAVGTPTTYTRVTNDKGSITINPRAVTTFRVTAQLVPGGWWLAPPRKIHKVTVTAPITCTNSPTKLYAKRVGTTSCSVPYLPAGSYVRPQYFGPTGWRNMTSFSTTVTGRFAYRYSFSGPGWSRLRVVIAANNVYVATTSPAKYIKIY